MSHPVPRMRFLVPLRLSRTALLYYVSMLRLISLLQARDNLRNGVPWRRKKTKSAWIATLAAARRVSRKLATNDMRERLPYSVRDATRRPPEISCQRCQEGFSKQILEGNFVDEKLQLSPTVWLRVAHVAQQTPVQNSEWEMHSQRGIPHPFALTPAQPPPSRKLNKGPKLPD